jgi:hypothetical protein
VESQPHQSVRGDLARAVVEGGWDLNELRPSAVSLEQIFLQLTGDKATATDETSPAGQKDEAEKDQPEETTAGASS